ncbi:BREX-1 system adenine-specific DNA-methyltransferase PglX [Photobacterium phosphoreum]|uniref:site-specific DNA-methyltransferase (adenine-specific) n=1 Tax=Photobacterium phosphoreum TaxID=659 RepID=A0AAW4ZT59_PHOPO|nr:BREX-1 system adenine-specific DNA-methyltransferase PglX [Photobacterium phosphoreum]MCD9489947.1 BREX-1 system adenine-specific DNA-methyltransferase PglX [Photobacterium phosphoreum]MCF2189213.1 BREX-1 system adenine-specific DNA-methyltransferase PglX [Photobacterium phosphoreum]MCF2301072.1 BREX-1 system adenine-specific DNA-methyltransferase PglX [Photobacterium phosphoreum]
MNTNKLKAYAPKARLAFMDAVTKRAAHLGLYADRIADMTIDGDSAIIEGRVFTREQGQQRNQLVNRIKALGTTNDKLVLKDGFNQFINETAFTWFNRFTAIRYMEVNEYLDHGYRVLSNGVNAEFGQGFEILPHAADVADDLGLNKSDIVDMLLDGNKEEELYRAILLGQCHQLSEAMSFMFEKLDDSTELLLPDNLTKTDSLLKSLINDIPEDNWKDSETGKGQIEVIGWLYQFYISEHKDAVIGKVVKREDIPAATQLFTPNWIVKYLVQNSLGRQWLATYPDSELKEKMEYYITPAEQSDDVIEQLKAITPTSIEPEQIKVLDPACGSGHILVEVYEVLREIYLERGYRPREIPELILTKNIYGLDIDDRAAQMAAFAVLMKAREDDKRIFSRDIKLNIHSIQSTENLNINQLWADLDLDGNKQSGTMDDLFADPQLELVEASAENKVYLDLLHYLKEQFIDAKNLGSLIDVDSQYQESLTKLQEKLVDKAQDSEPIAKKTAEVLLPIVEQSIVLVTKYDVAVANPPYMGSKGMNAALKDFAKKSFPNSKSDLFAIFMERVFNFLKEDGYNAQVNMQSWMFLSSFEKMRESLLDTKTFITMAHLGARAFGQISGEVVQTTAWVINKGFNNGYQPTFIRLVDGNETSKKQSLLEREHLFTSTNQENFKLIPGCPIAYWVTPTIRGAFEAGKPLSRTTPVAVGLQTGSNELFVRYWPEIPIDKFGIGLTNRECAKKSAKKWFPYNKGGEFRKWYGNNDYVVNWENDGSEIKNFTDDRGNVRSRPQNTEFYFRKSITWSFVSSTSFGGRYSDSGAIFDVGGSSAFPSEEDSLWITGLLCSKQAFQFMKIMNPTLNFQVGNVALLPVIESALKPHKAKLNQLCENLISIHKNDWNRFEQSWNFNSNPLVQLCENSIQHAFNKRVLLDKETINNVIRQEEEVNKIFIDTYSISDDISPLISEQEVTLLANPLYRYSTGEIFNRFQSETIVELISYSLGCSMGRYSLDREGLVYAHSGNNGFKELVVEGAYNTFPADDDGIVPLADEDWVFEDDATTRFREFVKTVWGEEHLQENLDFVAESLCLNAIKPLSGKKGQGESSMDTIRRYFATQFFKDHMKTYKKRPIYWLFSSGKEKAFECLVYLHRYNESTLSRMRTEYVTPLMGKLESRKNILEDSKATATGAELRAIDKELKTIDKKQAELVKFDEELKHLAEMKISIDLDDGVKVNYGKFGNLLADVKGIHGKAPEKIK